MTEINELKTGKLLNFIDGPTVICWGKTDQQLYDFISKATNNLISYKSTLLTTNVD